MLPLQAVDNFTFACDAAALTITFVRGTDGAFTRGALKTGGTRGVRFERQD